MSVVRRSVRGMLIDCETCSQRDVACADCVVTFLTIPSRAREAVPAIARAEIARAEISDAEGRALSVLAGCGLVPPLRMTPRRASPRAG